jgi:transcriptional regulator with XRE-family HTH domain
MTIQQLGADVHESRGAVISRRLRELMAGRRLHGKDMAHVLDMSQPAFSRRLIGELEFTPSQIERIASVLQVNEAYLYGFTDDRSPRQTVSGGGSMFVLPERTTGLSAALRACRDSNPKPSDP